MGDANPRSRSMSDDIPNPMDMHEDRRSAVERMRVLATCAPDHLLVTRQRTACPPLEASAPGPGTTPPPTNGRINGPRRGLAGPGGPPGALEPRAQPTGAVGQGSVLTRRRERLATALDPCTYSVARADLMPKYRFERGLHVGMQRATRRSSSPLQRASNPQPRRR